jgi:glycosyltransferase involved in cell wall biosynthesis
MHHTPSRKQISIVSPCFNEEENVQQCYCAVRKCFEEQLAEYDYEHIFCDNASTDGTVEVLERLARDDDRLKLIVNARNFGPLRSTYNGVVAATGDAVLTMLPVDLQDPPSVLPEMIKHWEQGHEVVYGIRAQREEGWLMRSVRRAYYRAVRRFSNIDIPLNVGSFQLIDRVVVDALRKFGDHYPHLPGMIASCGFRRIGVPYTWKARARGFSKNRLWHLADEALNAMISFSCLPMRLSMIAGCTIAALSLLYAAVSLVLNVIYFRQLAPAGIPSLVIAVFFFAGIQLFFLGVLGEYISAIHFQVRHRPMVIERKRVNFGETTGRLRNPGILGEQQILKEIGELVALTKSAPPQPAEKPLPETRT